jgi:hypothetical protein
MRLLGMPLGSSPMRPDGCDPTGLKYRNTTTDLTRTTTTTTRMEPNGPSTISNGKHVRKPSAVSLFGVKDVPGVLPFVLLLQCHVFGAFEVLEHLLDHVLRAAVCVGDAGARRRVYERQVRIGGAGTSEKYTLWKGDKRRIRGEQARVLLPSVMGTAALPYTVAEDENTMARHPWRSISLSSVTVEPRLFS